MTAVRVCAVVVLGGFLADRYGFTLMLTVALILYAIATVLRVWMARNARFVGHGPVERPSLRSLAVSMKALAAMMAAGGLFAWVLLIDGVGDTAFSLSFELQPLYLAQLGGLAVAQIGALTSLRGLFTMLTTAPAGWLSDRWGERVGIAAGLLAQFAGFVAFLQARDLVAFAVAVALFGAGSGVLIPAFDSLISKAVPEKMRGVAFGLLGTSVGLVSLPAPWIGAQLWERVSPAFPFMITALALLVSVVPVWMKLVLPARQDGVSAKTAT